MKPPVFWIGLLLSLMSLLAVEGCRSCTRAENCDECVARCVDTQKVSPDICRATACASVCGNNK